MLDKMAIKDFCRMCGAAIWKAQWCGFAVLADCTPIDTQTEVECLLAKRDTFGVSKWWPSFYLERRSMVNIHRQYELILTKHLCGSAQAVKTHLEYWAKPQPTATHF